MKWEIENEAKEIGRGQVTEDVICPTGHYFVGELGLYSVDNR